MLCFIHIERAGGTTLHYVLRNNDPLRYLTLTPWFYEANEPGNWLTADELRWLLRLLPHTRGIGGHTPRSFLDYEAPAGGPLQYFTFLRDPVKRWTSHYNYQREVMGVPWTAEAFLDEPHFADFQTVRIAGARDLGAAKRQLERFAFVGLSDRFDEGLLLLRRALGRPEMDLRYARQNAGRATRPDPALEDPAIRARILEVNALDQALYDFAREEIYPRYVEAYGAGLDDDLAALQRANEGFNFQRRRRWLWGGYRAAGYRRIERVLHELHHRGRGYTRGGQRRTN